MKYSVLLHNIRSVYNVGSILRTADAAGFHHVYFSGYTPTPIDRFGRKRSDIAKVSLGAEDTIAWSSITDINTLKQEGVHLVAVEQDERSVPYTDFKVEEGSKEVILIMGEETKGIDNETLSCADTILEIPMHGAKESLNVSVAFGIVAYELTR